MEKSDLGINEKVRKDKGLLKASQNAYFKNMSCQTSMISQLFIVKCLMKVFSIQFFISICL